MVVGSASDVIDMLNDLIQLDYDAIQAYEAAIPRIDNSDHQAQLAAFKDDHDRHVRELDHVIRELGRKPVNGSAISQVMTAGKIAFADMIGDKTVLRALKTEVNGATKAYERAAARRDLPPKAVPVIQAALDDERRHHDWIEKTIAAS
jgi:uncharacterized protein (TIGR02284 family)